MILQKGHMWLCKSNLACSKRWVRWSMGVLSTIWHFIFLLNKMAKMKPTNDITEKATWTLVECVMFHHATCVTSTSGFIFAILFSGRRTFQTGNETPIDHLVYLFKRAQFALTAAAVAPQRLWHLAHDTAISQWEEIRGDVLGPQNVFTCGKAGRSMNH